MKIGCLIGTTLVAMVLTLSPLAGSAQSVLRVAVQQEPATLNPVIGARSIEDDAANLLFDGLFRNDQEGNLVPDLATRVPTQQNGDISRDHLRITYHLVRNARWQDGQPVTADDVKFTFDAIMDQRNDVLSRWPYEEFARVETPDPYTVVVHLKQPSAPVVAIAFTTGIRDTIVPAHILRNSANLNHDPFGTMPVGSGPYRLVSWNHGSDMVFEANPAYFRGAPKIERIVWRFMPDENTISAALRSHEVDLADKLGIATYAQLGNVPGLVPALRWSLFWEHLGFNTASGPLQDVRVRRALCEGMSTSEIYAKAVHGIGELGAGMQHPRSRWYDRSLQPCRFDPTHAKALLDQAGWHIGTNGIRVKDGRPLQITFATIAGIIDRQQTQVILQSRWHDLGVDTVLKTYPPSTFFAPAQAGGVLYGGKIDVALCAFPMYSEDPARSQIDTSSGIPPAGVNHAFWRNARVDALEEKGERTFEPATRKRIYDEIQQIEAAEVPYVTMRWWTLIAMQRAARNSVRLGRHRREHRGPQAEAPHFRRDVEQTLELASSRPTKARPITLG